MAQKTYRHNTSRTDSKHKSSDQRRFSQVRLATSGDTVTAQKWEHPSIQDHVCMLQMQQRIMLMQYTGVNLPHQADSITFKHKPNILSCGL
jgi:hypothetical protein